MAPPDDYGWAYIDAQRATASADGPSGSLQFRWGSEDLSPGMFSGSDDLVFYAASDSHKADPNASGSALYLYGDMYVTGAIHAETYTIRQVTATEVDVSGSTIFGDTSDDTHRRTGSLEVSSNALISGDLYVANKIIHKDDGEGGLSDTYIDFGVDQLVLRAGSTSMMKIYGSDSSGSQNYIGLNYGAGTNDTDFFLYDGTGGGTYQFYVRGNDSAVATPGSMHISAALGPVTGSGEIHASRLVSNDIFTSGSIGIGTSDPLAEPNEKNDLVIGDHTGNRGMTIASVNTGVGTIRFSPYTSANNGEGWIDYSGNTNKMRFGTNGLNTRMTIGAAGNVGIATASPAMTLDVNGTDGDGGVNITGSLDVTADAVIQGTLWAAGALIHVGDSDTKIVFADDSIDIRAGNVRMINMTEDGTQDNVTINTANADVDFIVDGDTNDKIFHVQAAVEGNGPAEMVHISGTLGPVSGSGEIHATGFTGNDAILSASLTIGTANAVGSQVPLTINRSGSTQAVVIAGGMTASHAVHVEHLYTNDLYVSGTAYGITVDRANYASASDPGTTRTYSPTGFDTSGYLHVSGSSILGGAFATTHQVTGSFEVRGPSNFTGEVTAENGLVVGTNFIMPDNTSAKILVADGNSYQEVAVSGDVSIASDGAITIGAGAVEGSMLADNVISGQGALGSAAVAQADLLMLDDGPGTVKKVTFSNFEDSIFANVSGDATVAAGGALTIAAAAVEHGMVAETVIGSATNLGATAAQADELLIYDANASVGGRLKAITISNLEDTVFGNISGDATVAAGGALTIANQAVENSMLADDAVGADELAANAVVNASIVDGTINADKLDIDGSTDIGEALIDADLFIVDNGAGGTNRKSELSRLKTYTKTDIGSVGTAEANKAIIVDNNVAINSGLTSVTGSKDLYFKDVKATSNLISDGGLLVSGSATVAAGLTSSYGMSIPDHEKLRIGSSSDLKISHNTTNTLFVNETGHLRFDNQATGKHIQMDLGADDATTQFQVRNNAGTELFSIDTVGTAVTGTLEVSSTTNLQATNLFGATSGSSTLAIQGSASFGAPVDISGDLVFHAAATAGRIDIKVNDGAGADTAIQIGKNGIVTKIGDDTPSDGQYLSWDNTAGKVAWADGLTVWGMSGSDNHYSSTEFRTSGDLKVSGSITFGAGATLSGSAAGPSSYLVLDANNQIKMASPFYNTDNSEILFGADEEVRLIHSPDDGLIIKRTATGDNSPTTLTLQTGETAIVNADVIGALQFQAPDETQGSDGALVVASIIATATDTFDATSNSTKLSFRTATDGAAVTHVDLMEDGKLQGYATNSATWDITADGTGSFQQLAVADKLVHVGDSDTGIFLETNSVKIHAQTNSQPQITVNNTEVVINEESTILNFRVESNSQDKMFFVDGNANKIQISNGFGDSGIDIHQTGSIQMNGHIQAVGGFVTEGNIEVSGDLTVGGDLIALSATPEFTTVTVAGAIQHLDDANTKVAFDTDQLTLWAGGRNMLQFIEDDSQDTARFNTANQDIDFIVSTTQTSGSFKIDGDTGDIHLGGDTVTYDHSEGSILIRPGITDQGTLILASRDGTSADDAQLDFRRYTDGSFADGDNLGIIQWKGSEDEDGTYYPAAGIMAEVDEAAWTDGSSTAGRLKFFTTPDASAALSTALMLDSSQNATFYGDVTVSGNDIKDSGANTILSFDGNGNIDNDVSIQSATAKLELISTAGMGALDFYGDGTGMVDGDNIGAVRFYGTEDAGTGNSVQVGYMLCEVADAAFAHGSSAGAMIKFAVGVDGGTSTDEVLYINGNTTEARVGIGVEAPEKMLHVYGANNSTGYVALIENGSNNDQADGLAVKIAGDTTPEGGNSFLKFLGGATTVGYIVGDGSGGVTYTEPFTGKHPTVTADASNSLLVGLIMSSTGEIWVRNTETVSTGLPKTTMANTDNDKGVFGIISDTPTFDPNVTEGGLDGEWSIYDGYFKFNGVGEDESALVVNSMGEGLVWVTNKNGEVEQGDYICSTVVPGHGGKQADDLLHNYTVAKCVETIDWDSVTDTIDYNGITYKKYLTACTYNCG